MYANLTVSGRLGSDPVLNYSGSGTAYCRLNVACAGEKKGDTLWVGVTVFGKTAENCAQYLTKGRTIIAHGTPTVTTGKDGKAYLSMSADVVKFGSDGGGGINAHPNASAAVAAAVQTVNAHMQTPHTQPPRNAPGRREPQQENLDTYVPF